jgi:hypothetical protein
LDLIPQSFLGSLSLLFHLFLLNIWHHIWALYTLNSLYSLFTSFPNIR